MLELFYRKDIQQMSFSFPCPLATEDEAFFVGREAAAAEAGARVV